MRFLACCFLFLSCIAFGLRAQDSDAPDLAIYWIELEGQAPVGDAFIWFDGQQEVVVNGEWDAFVPAGQYSRTFQYKDSQTTKLITIVNSGGFTTYYDSEHILPGETAFFSLVEKHGGINASNATYVLDSQPIIGVTIFDSNTGIIQYTPPVDYNGFDSFVWRVLVNGQDIAAGNRIDIEVAENQPPVAADSISQVKKGVIDSIALQWYDPNVYAINTIWATTFPDLLGSNAFFQAGSCNDPNMTPCILYWTSFQQTSIPVYTSADLGVLDSFQYYVTDEKGGQSATKTVDLEVAQ